MGVCCIVFDIDGMLLEFFMNFLNIEKNKILRIFFQYFMFSSRFMLFPTLKTKIWCKQKKFGGGGCWIFFLEKQFSHFTFYAIFNITKKYWKGDLGVGGGGGDVFLTFYAISNISRTKNLGIQNNYFSFNVFFVFFFVCWKYWKVPLHLQLLVKWEVVSLNSRYREFYHEIGNIEKFPFTYWLNGGGGFSKS